eukprot:1184954-Prorocentrum_minimum.AAC.6
MSLINRRTFQSVSTPRCSTQPRGGWTSGSTPRSSKPLKQTIQPFTGHSSRPRARQAHCQIDHCQIEYLGGELNSPVVERLNKGLNTGETLSWLKLHHSVPLTQSSCRPIAGGRRAYT